MEAGELLHEALARELFEETRLRLNPPGPLASTVQVDASQASGHTTTGFVFEVQVWEGEIKLSDADGLVVKAGFFALQDGIVRLASLPWASMREPVLAYLRQEVDPGAV